MFRPLKDNGQPQPGGRGVVGGPTLSPADGSLLTDRKIDNPIKINSGNGMPISKQSVAKEA